MGSIKKVHVFWQKGPRICKVRRVKFIALAEVHSSPKANIASEKILGRTLSFGVNIFCFCVSKFWIVLELGNGQGIT